VSLSLGSDPSPTANGGATGASEPIIFVAIGLGKAHRPAIPFEISKGISELKTAISRKLSMLAADGVTDPIELREWALEGFVLR
jgi:hypothetical protein